MKKHRLRILAFVSLAILPATSYAFQIAVEGGLSLDSPSVTVTSGTAPTIASKSGFAYGVFAGYSMLPGFQLESGLMNLPRHFTSTDSGGNLADVSFNNWLVPLLARFTAVPLLSFAAGPYYAMGTGQISTTVTPAGGSAGTPTLSDFDSSSGIKKSGYGLMASARFEMPVLPTLALLLDGRYLMDLSDRSSNATQSVKYKDIQVLVGASFGF